MTKGPCMNVNSALFHNKLDQMVIIFIFADFILFSPKPPTCTKGQISDPDTIEFALSLYVIGFTFIDAKRSN